MISSAKINLIQNIPVFNPQSGVKFRLSLFYRNVKSLNISVLGMKLRMFTHVVLNDK